MRRVILAILTIAFALHSDAGAFWHGQSTTSYEGAVATRGIASNAGVFTQTQGMARTGHYSRTAITSFRIVSANFAKGEIPTGATTTLTASVEYPAGVCTQITYSGLMSGSILSGGLLFSDPVSISIPDNTLFWLRQYQVNTAGIIGVNTNWDNHTDLGDSFDAGASGIADRTVDCSTVPNNTPNVIYPPIAILGTTTKPSVCLLGNSITGGTGDIANSVGNAGLTARSIGPSFGYLELGSPGEQAAEFVGSQGTQRRTLLPKCSHVIVEYGSNDMAFGGSNAAALEANLTTIYGFPPASAKTFQTTILPRTDAMNAPISVFFETNRVSINTALRNATFGPNAGFFDATTVVEGSLNSGTWKVGGACTPWTDDNVHPNPCSYTQVQTSGIIDTSRIHLP